MLFSGVSLERLGSGRRRIASIHALGIYFILPMCGVLRTGSEHSVCGSIALKCGLSYPSSPSCPMYHTPPSLAAPGDPVSHLWVLPCSSQAPAVDLACIAQGGLQLPDPPCTWTTLGARGHLTLYSLGPEVASPSIRPSPHFFTV